MIGKRVTMAKHTDTVVPESVWKRVMIPAWNIIKWIIPVVAILYLWKEGALSPDRLQFSNKAWYMIPAALAAQGMGTLIIGTRFHCLLRCLGAPSTLLGQVRIAFPGLLLQQIGSDVSFDAMRIIAAKQIGGTGPAIFASALVDRLLGIVALVLLTILALALFWQDGGWVLTAIIVVAGLAALPLLFWLSRRLSASWIARWLGKVPGAAFVAEIGDSLTRFRGCAANLAGLFLVSVANHLCLFIALYCCSHALVDTALAPSEAFTAGALSVFTTGLPLPLAGLGVGEAAFGQAVAHMRGTDVAAGFAAVFLMNRLLLFFLGGVSWFWLAGSKREKQNP